MFDYYKLGVLRPILAHSVAETEKLLHLAQLADNRSFPFLPKDSSIIAPGRKLEGIQIERCFQYEAL